MEKQTENRQMDMGRGEERMKFMERIPWKLTLPYVKFAVCLRELKQGLFTNLERWDGEGDGGWEVQKGGVYLWLIHVEI